MQRLPKCKSVERTLYLLRLLRAELESGGWGNADENELDEWTAHVADAVTCVVKLQKAKTAVDVEHVCAAHAKLMVPHHKVKIRSSRKANRAVQNCVGMTMAGIATASASSSATKP